MAGMAVARIGLVAAAATSAFVPRTDTAHAGDFAPRVPGIAPAGEAGPIHAESGGLADRDASAYDRGRADGEAAAEAVLAAERDVLRDLAASLEALRPVPEPVLAALLGAATARLLSDVAGLCPVDAAVFDARVRAVAAKVADAINPATLHLHPDDMPLLAAADLAVRVVGDSSIERGSMRLDTSDGWIEDGPALRIAQLREALTGIADEEMP